MFESVSIISPTIMNDQTSRHLYKKYKDSCFPEYDDEIVDNIIATQQEKLYKKEPASYCIVLDDFLGMCNQNGRKNNKIKFHSSRFRHYCASDEAKMIVLSTQKFMGVSNLIRSITNYFIRYRWANCRIVVTCSCEYCSCA